MRKLVFLFVLFLAGYALKAQVVFKASAPEAVVMGEQFQLVFSVNADGKDLRAPEIPDFNVLIGPSATRSFSSQLINGNITAETTLTYTYILMPKKEGTFNIAPATIKVKGANYTSNALVIKVLPPDKKNEAQTNGGESTSSINSEGLFVKMILSKKNVYEQEGVLVTFKLYSLYDCGLEGVKFPEFEGFLAQEIDLPNKQWVMENLNGRNYRSATLKQTVLYPQRSGKITIDAGSIDVVVRIPSQKKVQSIFDEFFDSYQDVQKKLIINPATIDVKPLPSGKPASFSGAVGNFTMNASISSDNVKANEAVTIKVNITGNGNVKLIKSPTVIFPNDFEIYDAKTETSSKATTTGVNGTRNIEYMAIPRYAGDFEIPVIEFSYFDVKSDSYKTIQAGPYKLHVEKGKDGEGGTAPVVSNFSSKESVKYLGKDIRYLKVKGINFAPKNELFFGSFLYVICYIVPLILFIIFFIVYRKQVKENSNIALVRTKKANKIAIRRLKQAGKLLKEHKKEAFYDEVLRALWGYLSDKLNIPQAALTKDNVEVELIKFGVDETLIKEFLDILNTCEFARYAPGQASDTMDKLYDLTIDAMGKMENTIKR